MKDVVLVNDIHQRIRYVRESKVMLDRDLAELYAVPTKALVQAVKRNLDRFPEDFMFQLTLKEAKIMRSQIVTASKRNSRFLPYAFTEQGVAMLSSVLHSKQAVQVNIVIMRVFVKIRELFLTQKVLADKLTEIEQKLKKYDGNFKRYSKQIALIFQTIQNLLRPAIKRNRRIGFQSDIPKIH